MRPSLRLLPVLLVLVATGARAQQSGESEPARWGFTFNLGAGGTRGDFDHTLQKAATGEFGFFRSRGAWRYGLGLSFGSFGMKPPYDHELEWGFQRVFVSGSRMFRADRSLRPYLQGRFGLARLHPRSELFAMDPLPEDFEIGDSPTKASNGFHAGVVPGVEWHLTAAMALDLSLLLDYYHVSKTDLSPVGHSPASSGFDWQARMGLTWWTDPGPGAAPVARDAWGIRPSWGWALGEASAINFGASAFNEYVRNANFNQISPRSWWSNLEEGFTYDDNEFSTNQFIHPFNGSQYYNAARSNGLSYWPSYAVALIGALQWELAGETHPMSFNDLVATGVGGAAVGEAQYRFSSMMLDNAARGSRRFFREAASFIVDPIRGFNRIVSGRAWKPRPNPSDRMDTNPPRQGNALMAGYRRIGNGNYPSLTHDTSDYGFLAYRHEHGNVFDNPRRHPFDYFTFRGQLNFGDKTKIGTIMIAGNWWTAPVGEYDSPKHMAAVVQHFEYINNNAFEYGGQSVGAAFFSRWGEPRRVAMDTRFDIMATLMGAVNSDLAVLAQVADQERLREYDYGPGGGGGARVALTYRGHPLIRAAYRLHFLYVTNGSVYHEDPRIGLDARHWLHAVEFQFNTPEFKGVGLGAEYGSFTRESHYKITLPQVLDPSVSITQVVKQSNPELRIYLRFFPGRL